MYYHRKISVFKVLFLYFICHYLNVCCCFCNENVEDNNQAKIKNTDIHKKHTDIHKKHTTEDKNIEKDKDKEKDKEKKKKMRDIYKQI